MEPFEINHRLPPILDLEPVYVWEAMTALNRRSAMGRVVINPPSTMAQVIPHKTGEAWYMCGRCGFACLNGDKMVQHKEKHLTEEEEPGPAASSNGDNEEDEDEDDDDGSNYREEDDEDGVRLEFKDDIIRLRKDHFECHVCHKMLVSLTGLKLHHLVHSHLRPYKCKICGATFKCAKYLWKHTKRSHDMSSENICAICPCRFETPQGLTNHRSFYHSYLTPVKEFPSVVVTTNQQEKALKPKLPLPKPKIKVQVPPKIKFNFKQNPTQTNSVKLAVPPKIKLNFKQSPTKSDSNSRVDNNAAILRQQVRTAIKKKKKRDIPTQKCPICCIQFQSAGSVRRHIRATHAGLGMFECVFCPCTFVSSVTLGGHQKKYHPNGESYEGEDAAAATADNA